MVAGFSLGNIESAVWGKLPTDTEIDKLQVFDKQYNQVRLRNIINTLVVKCTLDPSLRSEIESRFYVRRPNQPLHELVDNCIIDNDLLWRTKNDLMFTQWLIGVFINGLPEEDIPLGILIFI